MGQSFRRSISPLDAPHCQYTLNFKRCINDFPSNYCLCAVAQQGTGWFGIQTSIFLAR